MTRARTFIQVLVPRVRVLPAALPEALPLPFAAAPATLRAAGAATALLPFATVSAFAMLQTRAHGDDQHRYGAGDSGDDAGGFARGSAHHRGLREPTVAEPGHLLDQRGELGTRAAELRLVGGAAVGIVDQLHQRHETAVPGELAQHLKHLIAARTIAEAVDRRLQQAGAPGREMRQPRRSARFLHLRQQADDAEIENVRALVLAQLGEGSVR